MAALRPEQRQHRLQGNEAEDVLQHQEYVKDLRAYLQSSQILDTKVRYLTLRYLTLCKDIVSLLLGTDLVIVGLT